MSQNKQIKRGEIGQNRIDVDNKNNSQNFSPNDLELNRSESGLIKK
jgi:hypothetical protein